MGYNKKFCYINKIFSFSVIMGYSQFSVSEEGKFEAFASTSVIKQLYICVCVYINKIFFKFTCSVSAKTKKTINNEHPKLPKPFQLSLF